MLPEKAIHSTFVFATPDKTAVNWMVSPGKTAGAAGSTAKTSGGNATTAIPCFDVSTVLRASTRTGTFGDTIGAWYVPFPSIMPVDPSSALPSIDQMTVWATPGLPRTSAENRSVAPGASVTDAGVTRIESTCSLGPLTPVVLEVEPQASSTSARPSAIARATVRLILPVTVTRASPALPAEFARKLRSVEAHQIRRNRLSWQACTAHRRPAMVTAWTDFPVLSFIRSAINNHDRPARCSVPHLLAHSES